MKRRTQQRGIVNMGWEKRLIELVLKDQFVTTQVPCKPRCDNTNQLADLLESTAQRQLKDARIG
jgi:hypothetical protein